MTGRTFSQYLLDVSRSNEKSGEFAHILSAVSVSMKITAAMLSRGPLILKQTPGTPAHTPDEVNREVLRLATESLFTQTELIDQLAAISIEGSPEIFPVSASGRYLLTFEVLQGQENLTDNLAVASVFSILEREPDRGPVTEADFLQPGSRQVCAGIELFGPRTMLVLTTGRGVDGFTLDRDVGSFLLTHPKMRIPDAPVFAINATDARHWPEPVKRYVDECVQGVDGPRGEDFTMRWNASALVGAFRVLNSGGLFMVPASGQQANSLSPLIHSAAPMAFLAEQAGGGSTTGAQRVMDVVPESLASRTPCFFGSADEVARIERYFAEHSQGLDAEVSYPLFGNRSLFFD